jgi:two-component system sensor histidine kinase UhpB
MVEETAAASAERRGGRGRGSLFWRVFAANALVLLVAIAILAVSPATIHDPIRLREVAELLAVLAVMLVVSYVLLRRSLSPMSRLTSVIRSIDPQQPGRRAEGFTRTVSEVAGLADAFNGMLDRLEGEQRASVRRALQAQEGERLRVARELHDEIGQSLTAVALRVDRAAEDGGDHTGVLRDVSASVKRSLDDLRRISHELRPEALDDLGLINALIALCVRMERQSGVRIARDLESAVTGLDADIELVLYRVAQEALTNVVRHSQATIAWVTLARVHRDVVLKVSDNGRGLPPAATEHNGIAGMRERAMLVGGALGIQSTAASGLTVTLRIPADELAEVPAT